MYVLLVYRLLLMIVLVFVLCVGDENKLTLLNTSSVLEHLSVLLLDEDNIVRRNSCMALASISRHRQSLQSPHTALLAVLYQLFHAYTFTAI